MLSLTRDLIKKTQEADPSGSTVKIKPLTVCFWSDFMANPSIMYDLFAPNSRKLDYDPDKVKVMGTKDGMIRYVTCSVSIASLRQRLIGTGTRVSGWHSLPVCIFICPIAKA